MTSTKRAALCGREHRSKPEVTRWQSRGGCKPEQNQNLLHNMTRGWQTGARSHHRDALPEQPRAFSVSRSALWWKQNA